MRRQYRISSSIRSVVFASAIVAGGYGVALAQTPGQPPDEHKPPVWNPTSTRTFELFPAGDVYPVYVADPHRPTTGLSEAFYTRIRIPDSSSPRTWLTAGGRFGVARFGSTVPGGRFWQVSIDAGLDAVFDAQLKNDAIGWDGNYGLTVTTATAASPLAFKVAVLHVSAHLGDEYDDRTDLSRINYTREEVALGTAWRFKPRWRAYGDVGIAYRMRSEGQERLRWQGGLEYEARPTVFRGRMAWYGALDLSALEERDWRLDTSLQGGLVTRLGGRAYRMFVQWYDGRAPIGQFTDYSEASLSLGLKLDF
jgi:Protein of unknown function (DUF1207)